MNSKVAKAYGRIDPFTPRIVMLKFFACGGKVKMKEAIERTGLTPKDLFGFVKENGISYHRLIERCTEESYTEVDEQDFANDIDDVITSGKAAVYDELKPYVELKPRIHPMLIHLEQSREADLQNKLQGAKPRIKYEPKASSMRRRVTTNYFIVLSFVGDPKDGITNSYHPESFKTRSKAKKVWEEKYQNQIPFYCLKETTIQEQV